jgi:hypothetical protein
MCDHPAGVAGRRVAGYEMMLLAGPLRPEAADGLRALGRLCVDEFSVIEVGNALGSCRLCVGRLTDTGTGKSVRVHQEVAHDVILQPHDLLLGGTRTGRLLDDPVEVTSIDKFRVTYRQ